MKYSASQDIHVGVVGLGKLGSAMAATFSAKGFTTVGVDRDISVVGKMSRGEAPFVEPQVADLLAVPNSGLHVSSKFSDLHRTQLSFLVVPTPSRGDGSFETEFLRDAAGSLGRVLTDMHHYHVVVVTSTVLPGDVRNEIIPALEKASGKKHGDDFGVCYSPEFIALGSVVRDLLHPDFLLIGEGSPQAGDVLEDFYERLLARQVPVQRLSIENAEIAKIAVNSFVTLKISFANMVADFCEVVDGGDVDAVTGAMGLDPRIGPKYFRGGMGFAGPCFPRDNEALASYGLRNALDVSLLRANDQFNRNRTNALIEKIAQNTPKGGAVSVLGIAYKPGTSVVDASPGLALLSGLQKRGFQVIGYDELVLAEAVQNVGCDASLTNSLHEALSGRDTVVVASPSEYFASIDLKDFIDLDKVVTVIDCWRSVGGWSSQRNIRYLALGKSHD